MRYLSLLLVAHAVGCASPPPTAATYYRELGTVLCARADECGVPTSSPCVETFERAACDSPPLPACEARVTPDADDWRACLEAARTQPCDEQATGLLPEACASALRELGQ